VFIGLSVDPDVLRRRIDARVDEMVRQGLVEEVESLLEAGFREGVTAPQAIGYKEIVQALDGEISLEEAVEQIKVATHRYAKRQRTWFRKDQRIIWIDADSGDVEGMIDDALSVIGSLDGDDNAASE
jgi:tRNA dimethylallyltransferase